MAHGGAGIGSMYCEDVCASNKAGSNVLVMSCTGMETDGVGVECRWRDGTTAAAELDSEASTFTCAIPERLVTSSEVPLLTSRSGAPICETGQCGVRRRVASKADSLTSNAGEELAKDAQQPAPPGPDRTSPSFLGTFKQLSWTDRLLSVWIIGAMILGVILGEFTDISAKLDTVKVDTVSLPIALGLWLMMWPVLTKVRYEVLGQMLREPGMMKQVALSLVLNWLVGPALMTGLAWAGLPDLPGYRNGVILVGLARCIAMVLLWNQLARGHAEYCAVLVAINSIMQIVLYAPLAVFYIKVVSRQSGEFSVKFWDVARSVLIFLGGPLIAGIVLRYGVILVKGREWLDKKFMPWFGPVALLALIYTVLILFALQAKNVLSNIGDVFRVSVPMFMYFAIMWVGTLIVCRRFHSTYEKAVTQAFTASSNNFELAIAIAVGAFGINSQEALAATIGPLIEVPVLLALAYVALWLHHKLQWAKPPLPSPPPLQGPAIAAVQT